MESSARKSKDVSAAEAETRGRAVRRGSRQAASEVTVRASDFYSEWDGKPRVLSRGVTRSALYFERIALVTL